MEAVPQNKAIKLYKVKNESGYNHFITGLGKQANIGDVIEVNKDWKDKLVKENYKEVN